MPLRQRLTAAARSNVIPAATLASLNIWICWRLFTAEYTDHFSSIEGAFVSLARYISRHWGDFSWWPLWHCGMPYQDTYVPLLHLVVAATATLAKMTPVHAYHAVTAVAYSLGPVALYFMALRLGSSRGAAFLSALFYSLFSPCTLLLPEMARDVGGFWFGRRLQVLTAYGEGPHVSAMTLLLVAILALEHALSRRTGRAFGLAALSLALLFLTNVPGTMATGLAVFCWLVSQPSGLRRPAWAIAACAAILAYAIACYGLPPSSLATVMGNIGRMHEGFAAVLRKAPFLLALTLGAVAGLGWLLVRLRFPLVLRFAVLYTGLTTLLVVTSRHPQTFELLPQAGRLHLEMEIGLCLILGAAFWWLYCLIPRWIHPIVLALVLGPVVLQMDNYSSRARTDLKPVDLNRRSEYVSAQWVDTHLPGQRIYVTGSGSFWWNSFTDNPQLIGCCDQGQSMPVLERVPYEVNVPGGPERIANSTAYLQALGVQAMVVSGPQSTDEYKDIQSPQRFDAFLPALHRELGDTVYAIPQRTLSLGHVIHPGEAVPANPSTADVVRYAHVIQDAARPTADFEWLRGDTARIRAAALAPDDLVSVQVAWFAGWKAYVSGKRIPITTDGLGFQLLHPGCQGPCEISLHWSGRPDLLAAAFVSLSALGLLGYLLTRR